MATDEEVQEAVLEVLTSAFEEESGLVYVDASSVVEELADNGFENEEVEYNLDRLDSNHQIDYSKYVGGKGDIQLKPRGIVRYEELSGEEVIKSAHQKEVLEVLDEQKRSEPSSPMLSRDELLNGTSLEEDELDRAVWFMKEVGQIDALTHTGTPWWANAQITEQGISQLSRM